MNQMTDQEPAQSAQQAEESGQTPQSARVTLMQAIFGGNNEDNPYGVTPNELYAG